jgi:DNA-binding transcriptional LysR family regulator
MSDLDNRLFRYFVAVAEEQHFAHAAERLGITPPTLTQQIQKLESQLGVKLLKRRGNTKVIVTAAGQRFLAAAREGLDTLERAAAIARQAGRGELGRLEVGFVTSVSGAGLLRSWMDAFEQAHPAIDITMHKLVPRAQIAGILRRELDAGFMRAPNKYPSGVRGFEIYRQPLMLALPQEHPLARHDAIRPAMLANEAFVSTTVEIDLGFFSHPDVIAGIGNFIPRVVRRDDDIIAVLAYVGSGHGIAVVPELITKTMNVSNVVFRNIAADPVPQTSIAFVYGSDPSPPTNLLIRHMRRHALRDNGSSAAPPHHHESVIIPSALDLDPHPEGASEASLEGCRPQRLGLHPSRLGAERVIGPRFARTRWRRAPQDEVMSQQ